MRRRRGFAPLAPLALVACQRHTPPPSAKPAPDASVAAVAVDAAIDAAPPPDPPLPALGWTEARIELHDSWGGLGCAYRFAAHLAPRGDRFVGNATLEVGGMKELRHVDLPASAIAALEAVAQRALQHPLPVDPEPNKSWWTDDFPSGQITFAGKRPGSTMRLYFPNQRRQFHLERGREVVALDPPGGLGDSRPTPVWVAYQTLLDDGLGLRAWIDQYCR